MNFTVSITIDLPRDDVVRLLADPAHRPKWLRDLSVHEPLDGPDGHVGTRSRVVFGSGKREFECFETITRREPVDLTTIQPGSTVHFAREIEAPAMWSSAHERLTEAGPRATLWESDNEYRFGTVMMKLVGLVASGSFRKQTLRHMEDFKAFAERGTDVRDEAG